MTSSNDDLPIAKEPLAGLLLAAGASRRMGQPKQLLPVGGSTLLRRSIRTLKEGGLKPILVVLGAFAEQMVDEVQAEGVNYHICPHWAEGMGHSLSEGVQALQTIAPRTPGMFISLCDQPLLNWQIIHNFTRVFNEQEKPIIAAFYQDITGVPAIFHRDLFPDLIKLKGSQGARQLIRSREEEVYPLTFSGGKIDLDTPEDYEAFLARLHRDAPQTD